MDVENLDEMISTKESAISILFGAGNFRSWMLYFVPGDGTDMHYHANPETFLVLVRERRGQRFERRGAADSEKRSAFLGSQGLLPNHQNGNGTAGAVRQPLGSIRRAAHQGGRLGPQRAGSVNEAV